ncbi:DUF1194 domain-containing protein [Ruegeria spongiae]|uniref:DUF1194 domain-containing protein n=1 Tax=Ruegeria spongiae TaxID=2942209 RepID=UPI0027E50E1C|nr:DUF1194 domain-containing protein [Ruegeria spongiae]
MIRALVLTAFCLAAVGAQAQCRQALALGLDVSGSVDSQEYRMQLDGLANALLHPEIVTLLTAQPAAPARLAVYEWSGANDQRLLINWRDIRDRTDLDQISALLRATRRAEADPGTAVGAAMRFGAGMLVQQGDCWKRTLDLSGDGKHNLGPHPRDVQAELIAQGLTINGLLIGSDPRFGQNRRYGEIGELSAYYRAWVILGPGAFVEIALGFEHYEQAMVRKLRRELEAPAMSAIRPEHRLALRRPAPQ